MIRFKNYWKIWKTQQYETMRQHQYMMFVISKHKTNTKQFKQTTLYNHVNVLQRVLLVFLHVIKTCRFMSYCCSSYSLTLEFTN